MVEKSGAGQSGAGYTHGVAVFNERGFIQNLPVAVAFEPSGNMPTCYVVSVGEAGFRDLNRELGPFRFVLTDPNRAWAISCNEWYNLFAGKPELLIAMLGKSIDEARAEYLSFAKSIAKKPDEPLVKVAMHYSAL